MLRGCSEGIQRSSSIPRHAVPPLSAGWAGVATAAAAAAGPATQRRRDVVGPGARRCAAPLCAGAGKGLPRTSHRLATDQLWTSYGPATAQLAYCGRCAALPVSALGRAPRPGAAHPPPPVSRCEAVCFLGPAGAPGRGGGGADVSQRRRPWLQRDQRHRRWRRRKLAGAAAEGLVTGGLR
jgi:hypothetical protein